MKYFIFILYFFLLSCGYPDIDSVPSFNDLNITKNESIDLCKLTNTDKQVISDCLLNLDK